MNQRVRIASTRGTYEFVWDVFGRRVSNWSASSHALVESNAYTESSPIAVRSGGQRQYETQNWLGSERVRTTYNGGTAIAIAELPWGDGHTPSGDNGDQHDFAGMDRDLEDNTEQAQYRQYSTNLGRWQSPDPYTGSYDFGNPQSFDRYSYALNDPANLLDPSGLDSSQCAADFCVVAWTYSNCGVDPSSCGLFPGGAGLEGAGGTLALPTCNGPRTGNCINTQVRVIRIAAGAPSKQGTYWSCVRSGLQGFSLQSGLQNISGGRLGNGWLAGAFLGNSVQSVGDTIAALAQGNLGGAANAAGSEAFGDTAGSIATKTASYVPNVAITVGLQAASSTGSLSIEAGASIPFGSIAQSGAGLLSEGLSVLGALKLPYDLSVASFSAVACGIAY